MATIVTPGWDANDPAVHREDLIGQSGQELSLLRHPSYPFLAEISADPPDLFAECARWPQAYVERVAPLDPPLSKAHQLLSREKPKGFGWLPITWDGPTGLNDPRGSFAVRRSRDGSRVRSNYRVDGGEPLAER